MRRKKLSLDGNGGQTCPVRKKKKKKKEIPHE